MIISYIFYSILMFLLETDEIWNWVWIVLWIVLKYDFNGRNCIGIVLASKIDWLYCIVIVLLKCQLLIIVLELYWSQKGCIGQPCPLAIIILFRNTIYDRWSILDTTKNKIADRPSHYYLTEKAWNVHYGHTPPISYQSFHATFMKCFQMNHIQNLMLLSYSLPCKLEFDRLGTRFLGSTIISQSDCHSPNQLYIIGKKNLIRGSTSLWAYIIYN
jgi:hypothetical protein